SHTCRALAAAGFLPVSFDNLSEGKKSRVQWGPLVEGDITNPAHLHAAFQQHQPQAVMHFAAQISVPRSVSHPAETFATNTTGSLNLLQAMQQHKVGTIVFSSTAAVYGTPESSPIAEDAPKHPINPYGHSKLMVETMLQTFATAHQFRSAALRYFNAAGATPEANLGYQRQTPFHLIPLALQATLGQRPPLQLFGTDYPTPDGTAVRDYIHVTDLADAHVLALQHLLQAAPATTLALNLGTSQGHSVQQVLATCQKVTGQPVPHTTAPRRAGDPAQLVASSQKAQKILNWQPKNSSLENIIQTDWAWHQSLA
ncbi:MAG: UDP-glucose 4-epimerase GalE, partial [Proteobacteria bacterium]|nr:UDP-glucose 4-epimerase GalE [Pseudomonadota bacterium]